MFGRINNQNFEEVINFWGARSIKMTHKTTVKSVMQKSKHTSSSSTDKSGIIHFFQYIWLADNSKINCKDKKIITLYCLITKILSKQIIKSIIDNWWVMRNKVSFPFKHKCFDIFQIFFHRFLAKLCPSHVFVIFQIFVTWQFSFQFLPN